MEIIMKCPTISIKKQSLETTVICLLFSLSIIFPQTCYIPKILLLGMYVLIQMTSLKFLHNGNRTNIVVWSLIFLGSNIFFILLGEFYGHSAFRYYFNVEILWTTLFLIIFLNINSKQFFSLFSYIKESTKIVIILGLLAFVFINFFGAEQFLNFKGSVRPGYPFKAISGGGITSLLFFGILLFLLVIQKNESVLFVPLLIFFIIATSRRSFMLSLVLAPFFYILLNFLFLKKKKERRYINKIIKIVFLLMVVIIALLLIYDNLSEDFDLKEFVEFFKRAFKLVKSVEKNVDNSSYERGKQAIALIEGWKTNLFFGHGTAANASVIRSDVPGMYELTYLAILFQRGTIGFLIYVSVFAFLIFKMISLGMKYKEIRQFLFAIIAAFGCFLIANGTNPYLEAFDHLWYIFIPLVIIKLLEQEPEQFILIYKKYEKK